MTLPSYHQAALANTHVESHVLISKRHLGVSPTLDLARAATRIRVLCSNMDGFAAARADGLSGPPLFLSCLWDKQGDCKTTTQEIWGQLTTVRVLTQRNKTRTSTKGGPQSTQAKQRRLQEIQHAGWWQSPYDLLRGHKPLEIAVELLLINRQRCLLGRLRSRVGSLTRNTDV